MHNEDLTNDSAHSLTDMGRGKCKVLRLGTPARLVPRLDPLDIVLTGELQDEEQLKYILSHGIHLGFENKMLVDLTWATEISKFDNWQPFCKIRVGKTFTKILGDKAYVSEYHADDERRLDCGMHAFCFKEPPNSWFKAYQRWEDGLYQGIKCDVRKMFG